VEDEEKEEEEEERIVWLKMNEGDVVGFFCR